MLSPKIIAGIVSAIIVCLIIFVVGLQLWRHSTTRDSGPGYVKPIAPVSRKTGLAIIPSAQGYVPSSGDKFVHCSCRQRKGSVEW